MSFITSKSTSEMSNLTAIVLFCVIVVECLLVFSGNIFTITVFWQHRNRLKRTSFLLINLAVADLFVGIGQMTITGTIFILHHIDLIAIAFLTTFYFASLFFLAVISMERAYALIWPLRHRVASTKGYIYCVILVWVCGLSTGTLSFPVVNGILKVELWQVILSSLFILPLMIICVSYLAIRKRLNRRAPAIDMAHNRQNGLQQSKKLSRTLFIVIAVSLVCWLPIIIFHFIDYVCSTCVSLTLRLSLTVFHLANSLSNPIIYSFRIPFFRETLKRMKFRKHSKQYRVTYRT